MSPPAPAAVAAAVAPSTVDDGTRCGTSVTNADGTAGRPRYETTFLYHEDGAADLDTFEADVIAGFAAPDRFFPSKYFYDDAGSGTCRCRVCFEWQSAWGLEAWRGNGGGS